jgi:DNA-binding transcriptional LysR family regulator
MNLCCQWWHGPVVAGSGKIEKWPGKSDTPRMLDWNDLKYLLAVRRHGSTLAAAKELGLSQSTVRRRLEALESHAGRQLVKRVPQGYRLTDLGAELSPLLERVEDAVAAVERHLLASETDLVGVIRVTCPEAVGIRLLHSSLLDKFTARYPALRVEFMMTDKVVDLAKGEADIAIRAGEPMPADGALFGRKIADSQWGLYASRSYVDRCGRIGTIGDINKHAVVSYDGEMSDCRAARWLRAVAPDAKVTARSNNLPALMMAVKSATAVAPLPVVVAEGDDDLALMFGPIPELMTAFYLLMHQDLKRTPRVRALFDFIVDELDAIRPLLAGRLQDAPATDSV